MSIQEAAAPAQKHLSYLDAAKKTGTAAKFDEPAPFAKEAYEEHIAMMLADLRKLEGGVKAKQLELGRYLRVAKANMKGEFEDWVEGKFKEAHNFSRRTAFYYISLADAVDLSPNAVELTLQGVSNLVSKRTDPTVKQQAIAALDAGDIEAAAAILNGSKPKKSKTEAVVLGPTPIDKSTDALEDTPEHAAKLAAEERKANALEATQILLEGLGYEIILDLFEAYEKAGPKAFDKALRLLVLDAQAELEALGA